MKHTMVSTLLQDLAAVVQRHPPSEFRRLAAQLRDPAAMEQIADALERLVALQTRATGDRPPVSAPRPGGVVEYLKDRCSDDPDKLEILERMKTMLDRKQMLPDPGRLRNFAFHRGVQVPTGKGRGTIVNALIRQLAEQPLDEVKRAFVEAEKDENFGDVGRWSDTIQRGRGPAVTEEKAGGDEQSPDRE